jgi:hypothetical protein
MATGGWTSGGPGASWDFVARRFFQHEQFDFELQTALGQVAYGCGDVGELLTTAERIVDGDFDSWVSRWTATGSRLEEVAAACAAAGKSVSARAAFLRASQYYALALTGVDGTANPEALLLPTFAAHRRTFDAHVARLSPLAEKIEIPYEGGSMPGYFFRPGWEPTRRPTLILNNGSDGAVTGLWAGAGAGAVARGYNAVMFDGPGQQSMLFERGIAFRPDWERVITPIVDHLLEAPDVDPGRIALYGISQAGYWVPRALAFERRVAAGIADPGVFDVATAWLERLAPEMVQLLDAGDRESFDRYIEAGLKEAPTADRQTMAWRSKPYGTKSPFDTFSAVREYTLEGVADRITTPLLITDPEGEQFWPGQSRRLYDAVAGPKRLLPFAAAEGAGGHCEPMGRTLLEQRMFDWLDEVLAAPHQP